MTLKRQGVTVGVTGGRHLNKEIWERMVMDDQLSAHNSRVDRCQMDGTPGKRDSARYDGKKHVRH